MCLLCYYGYSAYYINCIYLDIIIIYIIYSYYCSIQI